MDHFPSHINQIISELKQHADPICTLEAYKDFLPKDKSLQLLFTKLGYIPERGSFSRIPSGSEILTEIFSVYENPYQHQSSTQMKVEFLKSFYENGLEILSKPEDLGIQGIGHQETEQPSPKKNYKGLRQLSLKVKQIISRKGFISYREVAYQLINQLELGEGESRVKEEKNILRRVYDALNVLIAAGVVVKKSKCYFWQGNSAQSSSLELKEKLNQIEAKTREIQLKKQELKDLASRYFAFRKLIERNKQNQQQTEIIEFPFIIVASEEGVGSKITIEFNKSQRDINIMFTNQFKIIGDTDLILNLDLEGQGPQETFPQLHNIIEPNSYAEGFTRELFRQLQSLLICKAWSLF